MAHKLADETLAAILAQHLAVPDAAFASTDRRSPFARIELSTSGLLVVCKRWMRVATPLLYETVILRSTAQAVALAAVLKKNKDFGRFVKKLRVEGGFGQGVQKIIAAAPNITDFCMTLQLWADDNVKGMCSAMSSMNPRRLVVISLNNGMRNNASTRLATQTLCECIASWSNLRTLVVPGSLSRDTSPEVLKAIEECKTIQSISLTGESPPIRPSHLLNALAANPTITSIQTGWTERSMEHTGEDFLNIFGGLPLSAQSSLASLSSEAKAKVTYASSDDVPTRRSVFFRDRRSPVMSLPLNPSYRPLATASDVDRVAIWTRVIEFAIGDALPRNPLAHPLYTLFNLGFGPDDYSDDYSDEPDWDDSDSDSDSDDDMGFSHAFGLTSGPHRRQRFGPAVTCMLVCKEFKAIATRVACQHLAIYNPVALSEIAQLFTREPELAGETKSLTFFNFREALHGPVLRTVLRKLTALREFTCTVNSRLSVDNLSALAEGSGRSLTYLAMEGPSLCGQGTISFLDGFSSLQTLRWEGTAVLDVVEDGDGICLPSLTKLVVGECHFSFLVALAHCELPKLDTLEFSKAVGTLPAAVDQFFAAHGDKIRVGISGNAVLGTVLRGCPRLREFDFEHRTVGGAHRFGLDILQHAQHDAPQMKGLSHETLEIFKLPLVDRRTWEPFFASLSSKTFPALHTIKVPNRNLWPATQREISKSAWPPIAERLLAFGIKIQDGEGIAWRPRLQRRK